MTNIFRTQFSCVEMIPPKLGFATLRCLEKENSSQMLVKNVFYHGTKVKITKKKTKNPRKCFPLNFPATKKTDFSTNVVETTTWKPTESSGSAPILGSKQHTAKTEAASTPQNRGFGFSFGVVFVWGFQTLLLSIIYTGWLIGDPYNGFF